MVLVPVGGDDRVELLAARFFDLRGDALHVRATARGAEVDQNTLVLQRRLVMERQQKAIAKADDEHADGYFDGFSRQCGRPPNPPRA